MNGRYELPYDGRGTPKPVRIKFGEIEHCYV